MEEKPKSITGHIVSMLCVVNLLVVAGLALFMLNAVAGFPVTWPFRFPFPKYCLLVLLVSLPLLLFFSFFNGNKPFFRNKIFVRIFAGVFFLSIIFILSEALWIAWEPGNFFYFGSHKIMLRDFCLGFAFVIISIISLGVYNHRKNQ